MSNLVPLNIRQYIQKMVLSFPIGVKVYVLGDTALDLALGKAPKCISLWITGTEILTEGKHYSKKILDNSIWSPSWQLVLFGHEYDQYDEDDCGNGNEKIMAVHCSQMDNVDITLYFIEEQMSLLSLLKCLPMDILNCYVKDIASIDWEVSVVNTALDKKKVKVYGEDNTLFYYHGHEEVFRELVAEYKKKFPGYKFYMEM